MKLPFPLTPTSYLLPPILAPMAGVADRAMRELCMEMGAAFCCTEMVSAMGIFCGDRKSAQLMEIHERERPCGIQLFGKEPQVFRCAVENAMKYSPDFIDINMGCPAHKVAGHGAGAALMQSPALAGEIIKEAVGAVAGAVPVSVKMRAGWDDQNKNAVELARICEQAGAAWLTVHGRSRQQMYAPPVDLSIIREVKRAVKIPVIGNGDVTGLASAKAMQGATGCDAVMIGRAAQGRPWVFSPAAEPDIGGRMAILLRHVRLLCEYKGERIGMREARKHAAWYIKGLRGAAAFRQKIVSLRAYEELEEIAMELQA